MREKAGYIIGVVIAVLAAFFAGRYFNGGRVRDDIDRVKRIRESNNESGKRLDDSIDVIRRGKDSAEDARSGIKRARDILENARDRADN